MQKGCAHILLARNLVSAFLAPYLFLLLQMGTDLQASATYSVLVVIIISYRGVCVSGFRLWPALYSVPICTSIERCFSLILCAVGSSTAPAVLHILVPVLESPWVTLRGDQLTSVHRPINRPTDPPKKKKKKKIHRSVAISVAILAQTFWLSK